MDCPAEERLVRLKLDGDTAIRRIDLDIASRTATVWHEGNAERIENSLAELGLGSRRVRTEQSDLPEPTEQRDQRMLLLVVLAVNFSFFVIEVIAGLVSESMGLVADSLDMLADSLVYGISLFAVGGTVIRKKKVARIAGFIQIALATLGFAEVIRRFVGVDEAPEFSTMIAVSILALAANAFCLVLLRRSRSEDAHMQASTIFTSNDVVINLGVIVAGILVGLLGSNKPDLVIGAIVFVVVIRGATKILKLGR